MPNLIIYGAGGFGREVAWLAERGGYQVMAFADDAPSSTLVRGYPVISSLRDAMRRHPGAAVALATGDCAARQRMADCALALGASLPSLVDPSAQADLTTLRLGEGSIICALAAVTTDVTIGRFVNVNGASTIGHDAVLEDFVTLAGNVNVSGNVHIERDVRIGSGATIINGSPGRPLRIGAGAIIGAQACVTRDVEPGTTVVGVPARPIAVPARVE